MRLSTLSIAALILSFSFGAHAADYEVGMAAYLRGDFAAAVQEWEVLAREGLAAAQYNLGHIYSRGEGVEQSWSKARISVGLVR